MVYRGTALGATELDRIQGIVDADPALAQVRVAARVCVEFGWRRPNGEPASISCSVFLRALARQGLIRLAARRGKRSTRHADKDAAAILSALGTVPGLVECQPSGPLTVRPIAREEWDGFRLHLARYHYLGFVKPAGESLCYAAFLGTELVALLVWGAATPYNQSRDRFIGWDGAARERNLPWVVNNSRFLMLPWIRLPHLASRVLGANLRRLSRDWFARYGHGVLLAETFVETARFRGTCYRASNWIEVGQTQGCSRLRSGFVAHGRPKAVFVFSLHRRSRELLCHEDLRAGLGGQDRGALRKPLAQRAPKTVAV